MQDQLQQAQSPPQALRPCVVDSRPKAEAEGRPQLVGLLGLQRGPFGGNHEGQWNKTLEKKPAFCKWGDVPTDLVALSPSCDGFFILYSRDTVHNPRPASRGVLICYKLATGEVPELHLHHVNGSGRLSCRVRQTDVDDRRLEWRVDLRADSGGVRSVVRDTERLRGPGPEAWEASYPRGYASRVGVLCVACRGASAPATLGCVVYTHTPYDDLRGDEPRSHAVFREHAQADWEHVSPVTSLPPVGLRASADLYCLGLMLRHSDLFELG
ncbi:unnamed protein product [Arctogadus glacialis]